MKEVFRRIATTRPDLTPTIARLGLGLVILPHGLQKTVGMFGGYGFQGTMKFFTETMGIPSPVAFLVILTESVGSVLLILGLLGRVWAAAIAATMIAAVVMVHGQFGFFMNWFGAQKGEGFEFHLLAIALALITIVGGSGRFSVDHSLSNRLGHD